MDFTKPIYKGPRPKASLVTHGGKYDGRSFNLDHAVASIGRDSHQARYVLDDDTVSREHARLRLEGEQFTITYLGSPNGTYVNGKKIHRQTLSDNDVIRIGSTYLVYKYVSPDLGL